MSEQRPSAPGERRPQNQSDGSRGGRGHYNRRGRNRRHTFSGRKRFEELHYARGGTREDPLNLNGINGESPQSAPIPKPPPVPEQPEEPYKPKNRRDPLGLNQIGKEKKKRNRDKERDRSNSPVPGKQRKIGSPHPTSSAAGTSAPTTEKTSTEVDGQTEKPCSSQADKDKDKQKQAEAKKKEKQSKKEFYNNKYKYGNFDRYYGTRLDAGQKDTRLTVLKKEWFEKKSVLDIGCNVGFLTLSIAKEFEPRRILGIDIDDHLIGVARKNIRHYCDQGTEFVGKYPASFCNQFGPISQVTNTFGTKFPDNVWFRKENYVLECDELLDTVQEEFDVIMAFSITKWIHLNWGDDGMRRFFLRVFKHLLPGGRFFLEPQPFNSYMKRKNMTETTKEQFSKIEFKPDDFEMYLVEVVGFERVEHLGRPAAKAKGFERPIDMYVKRSPKFLNKGLNLPQILIEDSEESAGNTPNSVKSI